MPLIRPEVQKVLRAVGLEKEPASGSASEKLSNAGLDENRIAEELTAIATASGNEALRLKALETALRVHGSLREQTTTQLPSFNIIIQGSTEGSVNPILIPRQSLSLIIPTSQPTQEPQEQQDKKDATDNSRVN